LEKQRLLERLAALQGRLEAGLRLRLAEALRRTERLLRSPALCRPLDGIQARVQYLDGLTRRLSSALPRVSERLRYRLEAASGRLGDVLPRVAERRGARLALLLERWDGLGARLLKERRMRLESAIGQLRMLSPENVLQRGYSILRKKDGRVVCEPGDVLPGEELTGYLRKGRIPLRVH